MDTLLPFLQWQAVISSESFSVGLKEPCEEVAEALYTEDGAQTVHYGKKKHRQGVAESSSPQPSPWGNYTPSWYACNKKR